MKKDSPRRRARQLALQALYAFEMSNGDSATEIRENVITDKDLSPETLDFSRHLYDTVLANREWADGIISSLAANWKLERIARIDRIIMQMALTEIKEMPDIPIKVALNEALEMAKTFSTGESAAFINGILDRYVKSMPERPIPG